MQNAPKKKSWKTSNNDNNNNVENTSGDSTAAAARRLKTTGIGGADVAATAAQPLKRNTTGAAAANNNTSAPTRKSKKAVTVAVTSQPTDPRIGTVPTGSAPAPDDRVSKESLGTGAAPERNSAAIWGAEHDTAAAGGHQQHVRVVTNDIQPRSSKAHFVTKSSAIHQSSAVQQPQANVEGIWHLSRCDDIGGREIGALRFSENGNVLACGAHDGSIKLFDRKTGSQFNVLEDAETRANGGAPITSIRFRPLDSELAVATYANGVVKLWNCRHGKSLVTINQDSKALCASYSKKGDRLAVGCDTGEIYLYDANQMRLTSVLLPNRTVQGSGTGTTTVSAATGHTRRVFSVLYTRIHSHELVSGGWDNIVNVWDDRQPEAAVRQLYGPHVCGDGLDFDNEHELILAASWRKTLDDQLQLFDYKSGELVSNIVMRNDGFSASLYCAQFVGKDFILVGGSDTHCARLVQREAPYNTMARLTDIPGGVYYIDTTSRTSSSSSTTGGGGGRGGGTASAAAAAAAAAALPRLAVAASHFVYSMDMSMTGGDNVAGAGAADAAGGGKSGRNKGGARSNKPDELAEAQEMSAT